MAFLDIIHFTSEIFFPFINIKRSIIHAIKHQTVKLRPVTLAICFHPDRSIFTISVNIVILPLDASF